jgi:hypothetical protein
MAMRQGVDLLGWFAVEYAKRGWPVFPTNGKIPCIEGGFKNASTDPTVVRGYWREHPRRNIGLATGAIAWVLDVDPRHGGDTALSELEQRYGPLPETVRSHTGGDGNGTHHFFAPDLRITTVRGQLPAGLDVRGAGGYVVVPPSVTQHPYRWEIGAGPADLPFAVAPAWLPELIVQPTPHDDFGDDPITPGQRHEFLLRRGGQLAWFGLSDDAIRAELDVLNRTRCRPPLPGPGPDGWHRLLSTLKGYAKKGRAARRAEARTQTTTSPDEPIDDQTETGPDATDREWPDPLPLEAAVVPPFPLSALPPTLAEVVSDIATVTHTPVDFAGLGVLAVLSTLVSRRVDVAIGRTHVEPLNLYLMLIANSGERKGPVHRATLAPLFVLERRLRQEATPAITKAREVRKLAERRLERLRDQAARCDDPAERDQMGALAVELALALPAVPPMPTLVVSDRTVEMLEVELMQQDGALLLASEEAGTLLATMGGRHTRDGSLQLDVYLKAYDRGEIDVARISREPVQCATPELSLFITPQRALLRQLRARPEFHDRGLLPRFLFSLPPTPVGSRSVSTRAPAPLIRAAYAALVERLAQTWIRQAEGQDLPHLVLAGASWECWAAYYERVEHELLDEGCFGTIKEWGNKQPGRVARLAGLLHLAAHPDPIDLEISVATITAACQLGEYFEAHALATYDVMGTLPQVEGARRVLAWIRRMGQPTFIERDAARALGVGGAGRFFTTMDELRVSLLLLVEHGYLRRQVTIERVGSGRPSSSTYLVHPGYQQSRRQNRQNSDSVNSVDAPEPFPEPAEGSDGLDGRGG